MDDQTQTTFLARMTTASEIAARLGGIVLIIIYGSGFLVISLHNAAYGIAEFNLLRPRIFGAGALFILLTVLPVTAATRFTPLLETGLTTCATDRWSLVIEREIIIAMTSVGLAFVARFLFVDSLFLSNLGLAIVVAAMAFPIVISVAISVLHKKLASITVLVFSVVSLVLLSGAVTFSYATTFSRLTGWFFVTGALAQSLRDTYRSPTKSKEMEWERWVLYAISFVGLFSLFLYGRARTQFGGGAPIPVVVFATQKSPLMESESQQFFLVDENDQGFYLVTSVDDNHAIFLPRGSVSGLYFGQDFSMHKK